MINAESNRAHHLFDHRKPEYLSKSWTDVACFIGLCEDKRQHSESAAAVSSH